MGTYALHTTGTGTLTGSGKFQVTGNLLAEGTSKLSVTASQNSSLTGDAIGADTAVFNLSLTENSTWRGAAFDVTNITIDPSVWTMTASSTVMNTVTNAGLIEFTSPAAGVFKTLTAGNYVGADGTIASTRSSATTARRRTGW